MSDNHHLEGQTLTLKTIFLVGNICLVKYFRWYHQYRQNNHWKNNFSNDKIHLTKWQNRHGSICLFGINQLRNFKFEFIHHNRTDVCFLFGNSKQLSICHRLRMKIKELNVELFSLDNNLDKPIKLWIHSIKSIWFVQMLKTIPLKQVCKWNCRQENLLVI